jgi:hypothetical protein
VKVLPGVAACLLAVLANLCPVAHAEPHPGLNRTLDPNQAQRSFAPAIGGGSRNPYNLVDLDDFDPGEFDHCRWGVYQSQGVQFGPQCLFQYGALTATPLDKDLMVVTDLHALGHRYLLTREAVHVETSSSFFFDTPVPDQTYHLLRKHHFQIRGALVDARTETPITSTTQKAIVLIHGWNRVGNADSFEVGALHDLLQNLDDELSLSDWKLIPYHWERDADTGGALFTDEIGFVNATEAAEGSHCHGQHLGELLANTSPGLKRVHLISHSAGAWAARSTAKYLLAKIPGIDLQVTLLDPFVPGDHPDLDTPLDADKLTALSGFTSSTGRTPWRLENFFAYDVLSDLTSHGATSGYFNWTVVPHTESELLAEAYESHDGPIDYYRHSIDGTVDSSELEETRTRGWPDSMFRREPYFPLDFMTGQGGVLQPGETRTLEPSGTTRGGPLTPQATWQWYRSGEPIPGATQPTYTIASATPADAGAYHVDVTDSGLTSRSPVAFITVAGGALAIVSHPVGQFVTQGGTATFRVHANGTSLAYQWRVDGADIPGATGNTLQLLAVDPADSGKLYSVQVSDGTDNLTSESAILTVTQAPPTDANEPNDSSLTATPVTPGTLSEGLISHPGDVDWFTVPVTAGENLVITLQVPSGVDYDLELYDSSTNWAAGSYLTTGLTEGIAYSAPSAGTVWVRVLGYPTGGSSFDPQRPYVLHLGTLNGEFTYSEESDHVIITGFTGELAGPLVIPSIIGGKPVRVIADAAFQARENITSLSIPSGVISVGGFSFQNCTALASIALPPSLSSIGDHAFGGCSALNSVEFTGSNLNLGQWAFGYCGLESVVFGNEAVSLGQWAFGDCDALATVSFGIGSYSMANWAFGDCDALASVSFGDGIYNLGDWTFGDCDALASVSLGDGLYNLGDWTFGDCDALLSVGFGDGIYNLGDWTFGDCDALESVGFGEGVVNLGEWTFGGCTSLASVVFGEGDFTFGESSFGGCSSLVSISLPVSITHIANGTFIDCSSLASVLIPRGVAEIGDNAFRGCVSLASVDIPSGVTTIGERAFQGCSSLTSVTLPGLLTQIGNIAFAGCSGLSSVLFIGDPPQLGNDVFGGATPQFSIYYLHGSSGFSSPWWEGWPAVEIGAPARLLVRGPDGEVLSNGSTLHLGRHAYLAGSEIAALFTLANAGQATLTGLALEVNGEHAADFVAATLPAATLPSAGHTDTLIIFTPQGTGLRTAVLRIASSDATAQPYEIHLEAEAYDPYVELFNEWASAAGLNGPDAAPPAIPHGDGIPNLLRYAFRMDPAGDGPRQLAEGEGTIGLPSIRLTTRASDSQPVLRFEFIRAAGLGLGYLPQKSDDLTSWQPLLATPAVTTLPGLPEWERVVIEEPVPTTPTGTPTGQCFGRVSVSFSGVP